MKIPEIRAPEAMIHRNARQRGLQRRRLRASDLESEPKESACCFAVSAEVLELVLVARVGG
eukprot:950729-Pyramimonas_sp.AAC.1